VDQTTKFKIMYEDYCPTCGEELMILQYGWQICSSCGAVFMALISYDTSSGSKKDE